MKKITFILITLLFVANTFAATITIPEEAKDWNIPANAIDVLQAREICSNLSANATTGTKYYVMGYVKKIDSNHANNVSRYGNASFYLEQVKGANSAEDFYAYRVYGIDNLKITNPNTIAVGDFVVLYGELTKYQKNASSSPIYETVGSQAHIWNSTNPLISGNDTPSSDNTDETNGVITITDPDLWTNSEMSQFVGKEVQFTTPFYVTNNSKTGQLTIAPRRIFNPTNQALPLSMDYQSILSLNEQGTLTLTNVSGYHRIDERVHNLKVKVNSYNSLSFISGDWRGNTRAEMEKGYNLQAINARGEHTLLVCYMNLEYYIVEAFDSYGPANNTEHQAQRAKVSQALAKINADLYAFVEIQLGQGALAEIAADLTKNTGRNFSYVNDGSSINGTYTKSGYVYCTDKVTPYGNMQHNDTFVENRKKVQGFTEKASGEKFILSVNHFKAKSGSGSGANKDQGDGQGSYNAARVQEAYSITSPRDFKKTPKQGAELANHNIWSEACRRTSQILQAGQPGGPTEQQLFSRKIDKIPDYYTLEEAQSLLSDFRQRFQAQLPNTRGKHPDLQAPLDPTTGQGKRYTQLPNFIRAIIYHTLKSKSQHTHS